VAARRLKSDLPPTIFNNEKSQIRPKFSLSRPITLGAREEPRETVIIAILQVDYHQYYDYPLNGGSGGTSSSSRRVRHPYSRRHTSHSRRRRYSDGVTGSRSRSRSRSVDDLLLDSAEELFVDDDDRLSLQLDGVTSDDAGLYTCRAFNKAGAVNFTYTVHVTGMTSPPHTSTTPRRLCILR